MFALQKIVVLRKFGTMIFALASAAHRSAQITSTGTTTTAIASANQSPAQPGTTGMRTRAIVTASFSQIAPPLNQLIKLIFIILIANSANAVVTNQFKIVIF